MSRILIDQIACEEMVDDLCALEAGLSDWEVEFVDALSRRRPFQCTPREAEKIKQIWNERIG